MAAGQAVPSGVSFERLWAAAQRAHSVTIVGDALTAILAETDSALSAIDATTEPVLATRLRRIRAHALRGLGL